ncbi:16S rRNA pseudouridine(516) synthase RsuA [Litoribrevibacter albus]|uniref:Pseudouridine synthase n=1 Tax=Litoribrevibacter albus TaxID=1473156 RepID=A0AA37S893_9GAMM|nr:16S rRNA pseudouridine(516) synthase RsuA [Litoribrevibacter albus]GLQ31012.1 ribosomal small subunit pseudouridine synthase A [Litoribrevibacter albus]
MRLDKYLCHNAGLTRNEAKRAIKKKMVTVDGKVITNAALHVSLDQSVAIDNTQIEHLGTQYFMLNKPAGFVSATEDGFYPTVLELIDQPGKGLHPVGRLDLDTTGLMLLTNDGKWAHKVTSPNHDCHKTYQVELNQDITDKAIETLETGIYFKSEDRRTKPAKVKVITSTEIELTISEGMYHQVKRMIAAVDNEVLELHRSRIGDIVLDEDLEPGEYRPLTQEEIESIH